MQTRLHMCLVTAGSFLSLILFSSQFSQFTLSFWMMFLSLITHVLTSFTWSDMGYPSLQSEKNILPISCFYVFIKYNHQLIKRISFPQIMMDFSFFQYN